MSDRTRTPTTAAPGEHGLSSDGAASGGHGSGSDAPGPGLVVRSRRFLAFASLVARIYGGYKLIQVAGRLGARTGARYARHHRRSTRLLRHRRRGAEKDEIELHAGRV